MPDRDNEIMDRHLIDGLQQRAMRTLTRSARATEVVGREIMATSAKFHDAMRAADDMRKAVHHDIGASAVTRAAQEVLARDFDVRATVARSLDPRAGLLDEAFMQKPAERPEASSIDRVAAGGTRGTFNAEASGRQQGSLITAALATHAGMLERIARASEDTAAAILDGVPAG